MNTVPKEVFFTFISGEVTWYQMQMCLMGNNTVVLIWSITGMEPYFPCFSGIHFRWILADTKVYFYYKSIKTHTFEPCTYYIFPDDSPYSTLENILLFVSTTDSSVN